MGDFKYTFEKNKQKILLGLSAVTLGVAGVGVYFLVNSMDKEVPKDETPIYVDGNNIKAEYIIGANEDGVIDLIKLETNEVVDAKKLKSGKSVLYSRSNDLEKLLAFNSGKFISIVEEEGKLIEKDVFELSTDKEILDFKFSDKYIVSRTEDGLLISAIESKETDEIEVKDVDAYIIVGNKLVYAETENIHAYDLETKEGAEINIGDVTQSLTEHNGNVIVFNEFGSGKEKSTILNIKSGDLYIESVHRHDNKTIMPITNDSDDEVISYIDQSANAQKTMSHYQLTMGDKETKNRADLSNLGTDSEVEFTEENTVSTKGYLYTQGDGEIKIFRLSGEVVDSIVKTDKTFFMPISVENSSENK